MQILNKIHMAFVRKFAWMWCFRKKNSTEKSHHLYMSEICQIYPQNSECKLFNRVQHMGKSTVEDVVQAFHFSYHHFVPKGEFLFCAHRTKFVFHRFAYRKTRISQEKNRENSKDVVCLTYCVLGLIVPNRKNVDR